MNEDEEGLYDDIIPDLTGDGKADFIDFIIYNEILNQDNEKIVDDKTKPSKK